MASEHIPDCDALLTRLQDLRVALRNGDDDRDDQIRELYSALLEEYSADASAIQKIREFGVALERAVEKGEYPRAMVLRGSSRKKTP